MTPVAERARSRTHGRSPIAPRRISGPVARRPAPAPAGAGALPRTTSIFARVRALPEHRVVDRLLRSRAWIWALGLLLGGIVTMQVSLLKLNSGITRAVETATTLERQNADLEAAIARMSAPDRIESGASTLGMLMPAAGDVGYLTAAPGDPARARRRMEPPSDEAAALLANRGIVPGSLAAPATTTVPAATAPAATAPAATAPTTAAPTTAAPTTAAPTTAAPTTAAPTTVAPATATPVPTTTTPAATALVPGQG